MTDSKLQNHINSEAENLPHQDMLTDAITNARDKSVVSWWWISIPLFIIAMLTMKSIYMPHTTLVSNIHELKSKKAVSSLIFFLIVPLCIIILNTWSIRKVWSLSDNPKDSNSIQTIWVNALMIFFSILVLIIYAL